VGDWGERDWDSLLEHGAGAQDGSGRRGTDGRPLSSERRQPGVQDRGGAGGWRVGVLYTAALYFSRILVTWLLSAASVSYLTLRHLPRCAGGVGLSSP
jgi:hypothetical protein